MGQDIINKYDGIKKNNQLSNTMIDFYGHCGGDNIQTALEIFDDNTNKDTVSINCMMSNYINNHQFNEALQIYDNYKPLINEYIKCFSH